MSHSNEGLRQENRQLTTVQADASEITKESSNEFIFKVNGAKHTFQAANAAERDSWFVAVEAKAAAAKSEKEAITGSEGYKAEHEKLSKSMSILQWMITS